MKLKVVHILQRIVLRLYYARRTDGLCISIAVMTGIELTLPHHAVATCNTSTKILVSNSKVSVLYQLVCANL